MCEHICMHLWHRCNDVFVLPMLCYLVVYATLICNSMLKMVIKCACMYEIVIIHIFMCMDILDLYTQHWLNMYLYNGMYLKRYMIMHLMKLYSIYLDLKYWSMTCICRYHADIIVCSYLCNINVIVAVCPWIVCCSDMGLSLYVFCPFYILHNIFHIICKTQCQVLYSMRVSAFQKLASIFAQHKSKLPVNNYI